MKTKIRYAVIFILSLLLFKPPAQAQCTLVGWASQNGGVTGGGSATPTVVTNYSQLKSAITSSSVKVVHISGTITIPSGGRISFQDQTGKTIYGLPGSKLVSTDQSSSNSGILYVKRCKNIIFRNLTFEGPGAYDTDGWDNMTIDNSTNIWVDHCEFQDGLDGNLDIKNAADYISVTWCKFIYNKPPRSGGSGGSNDHRFSNLFGSSDGATGDRGKLRITLVNCWWAQGCKARMPRVRFGKVHVVNNYFNSTASSSCVMAGFEANLLVESNVFENVKNPIDKMDNTFTAITSRNNIFSGTSGNTTGSGTAFTPPYSLNITSASQVKSMVTAGAGATLNSPTCGGNTNTPPTVSITAPSNNASFTAPASITINANASDANGSVSNVQFYNGSTLLGSDASAPYSFTWNNVAAGSYTITAKATDNNGATTTSSPVSIVVNNPANTPPTVSITTPSNNASFTAPASITINANASDANGSVTNVQFYNGSTLLGSDASSPYSFTWNNVAAGNYTITTKATDNNGATTTSSSVSIVVNNPANTPPTVSITAPSNNASFSAPASVTINANASDANGSVTNVQFYNGSTLLGSDASAPYSFTWNNVAAGNYTITAKATDNDGATTTSSPISIVVNNVSTNTVTIQGETACTIDGIQNESDNSGFNGTGYANTDNQTGASVSWAVNSQSSQTITLSIRYANQSSTSRNMSLHVNNAVQASINFPTTGAWTNWNTASVQLNLSAGYNTIKLVALTNEGGPNIDELVFNTTTLSVASCTPPPADCNGVLGGSASIDNCGVCSGGNTGIVPNSTCTQDCNGVWGGSAYMDDCNTCVGGNTGKNPCVVGQAFTMQAETACDVDGIQSENKNSGFNGNGYVNTDNETGTAIRWTVNASSAQTVTLTIRYANESSNSRNMSLEVNNSIQVPVVNFPSTGSWTTWNTVDVSINLINGYNSIRLVSLMNEGGPNIDELVFHGSGLSVTGCTPPLPSDCNGVPGGTATIDNCGVCSGGNSGVDPNSSCSTTIQAETACTADGILSETKNSGYNGDGYVNLDNSTGTSVSWNVHSGSSQNVVMTIRYANASSANRKMEIRVNGTTQASNVDFNSTGSWSTWNTATVSLTLASGLNMIQAVSLTSEGAPNIDELVFNTGNINSESCLQTSSASTLVATAPQATIGPNPSETSFNLSSEFDIESYTVLNSFGQVMATGGPVPAGQEVQVGAELTTGTFVIQIMYLNGTLETLRLTKN